jgi:hypothetical protein
VRRKEGRKVKKGKKVLEVKGGKVKERKEQRKEARNEGRKGKSDDVSKLRNTLEGRKIKEGR